MPRARKRCAREGCDQVMPCPTHSTKRPGPRIYGSKHQSERAAWVPKVEAGQVHCRRGVKCRRWPNTLILPGTKWHLGHPDHECSEPTAPEHFRCNTGAAGSATRST